MKSIGYVTYMVIPVLICIILIYGIKKKINVYQLFVEGAFEGCKTTLKIFPNILAIMVAIFVFRESGALQIIINILKPITSLIGIPNEVIPLGFMSSVSGGASIGLLSNILESYGPDSQIGRIASTILGSSETTLYVLAVYTASIKDKNLRGALIIGLICDFIAFVVAVWLCK